MEREEEYEDSDSENELMEEEEEDDMESETHVSAREKDHSDFLEIMKVRFLQGMDTAFADYNQIDNNEDLDDWKQIERDAQDRYFEDENVTDILYSFPEESFFFEEGKIVTSSSGSWKIELLSKQ